ncbi:hypothetical protein TNCT_359341 [Trichonephila clavata]|uniref:Uncharacterized protein n=1 Tax=Trichonephila clavata TaxID=2740835 RepID=A0A8X6HW09_TRICU|nr:hypothetical protein TNCT_359341 [Trichonephila clavata]
MLLAGSTRYPSISSNGERNSPHAAGLTLRFTIHFYDVRKGTQSEAFASVDFERAVGHREDQAGSVAEQMRDSPKPPERPGEPSRETGCVPPKREIHGPGVPSTGPIRDGSPHRKQPPVRRARRNWDDGASRPTTWTRCRLRTRRRRRSASLRSRRQSPRREAAPQSGTIYSNAVPRRSTSPRPSDGIHRDDTLFRPLPSISYGPLPSIPYGPLPSGPLPSVRAGGRSSSVH